MTLKARLEAAISLFRSLGNVKLVIDIEDAEVFLQMLKEKEGQRNG